MDGQISEIAFDAPNIMHIAGVYLIFLIITIFIYFMHTNRSTTSGSVGPFASMCVSVIFLIISELTVMFSDVPTLNILASNASLVSACFFLTSLFLFSFRFYSTDDGRNSYIGVLLFLFPVVFAVIALSPVFSIVVELARTIQEEAIITDVPVVDFNVPLWDLWVWLSSLYSYAMLALSFVFLIIGHIRRPKFNMMPSVWAIAALLLAAIGVLASLFDIYTLSLDPIIVTFSLVLIATHVALSLNNFAVYSRYARLAAFHFLQHCVIVFDKSGHIADFNPSANKWFSSIGIDLRKSTQKTLNDKLKELGATVTTAPGVDEGEDVSLVYKDILMILNKRVFDISAKRRGLQGTIAFFFDVTHNREMLHKLEKEAGVDALSGLPNRMAFEGAKARYDMDPYHLPLSVIMGDLNDLKKTNDELGHKYGDLLIQIAAKTCQNACKSTDFVGRIGGDEFVFLLSQTDEEKAQAFIDELKNAMVEKSKAFPFTISMALGAATKKDEEESLDAMLGMADSRMYADKKAMKGESPRV